MDSTSRSSVYDPYDYGAKGDGTNLDTKFIQAAIDDCYSKGGGKVYLHSGTFISGTILLKGNITLHIASGTILKASDNLDDFPIMPSNYPSYDGSFVTNKMLIYAEDANNISISGRGTIDGNGDHWVEGPYGFPSMGLRPRIIHLRGCKNVLVQNVTLYNSASWVQSYQSCYNLVVDGVTVDSNPNKDIEKERFAKVKGRNTDGLDLIDCEKVRISNCFISSGDDGICIKSLSPDKVCRDITISNCIVSTNASGIKIGTETAGKITDVLVSNCTVYDTRNEAISLMTVDGAQLERIQFSKISLRNIKGSAIYIRAGERLRSYRKGTKLNTPYLKDIIIENVTGTRISKGYACIVAGTKDFPIENVLIKNINLQFEGGGKAEESFRDIPEKEDKYPNGRIFGVLPAYGFYVRHANNIIFDDMQLKSSLPDERPAFIGEDITDLEIRNFQAQGTANSPELIRLNDVRQVLISGCYPLQPMPVFLSVYGNGSNDIILLNNRLKNTIKNIEINSGNEKFNIEEINTLN
ncbi:glycoside hydrolase family 28 protein [Maribacter sp. ANRC-HE7]|uniref:Glycoside hydrolase family 28 protein n=1 Tax=Maribacter aquimaris TaxID=2737171 RepID=A0ABR7UZ72_9FLAO|nr:glycoside hydrolase family 28 protein [Maribacter aquimaris]MBD0777838.1 glycoside hydrolase family 28 protein [Maribacter aquimaris]